MSSSYEQARDLIRLWVTAAQHERFDMLYACVDGGDVDVISKGLKSLVTKLSAVDKMLALIAAELALSGLTFNVDTASAFLTEDRRRQRRARHMLEQMPLYASDDGEQEN